MDTGDSVLRCDRIRPSAPAIWLVRALRQHFSLTIQWLHSPETPPQSVDWPALLLGRHPRPLALPHPGTPPELLWQFHSPVGVHEDRLSQVESVESVLLLDPSGHTALSGKSPFLLQTHPLRPLHPTWCRWPRLRRLWEYLLNHQILHTILREIACRDWFVCCVDNQPEPVVRGLEVSQSRLETALADLAQWRTRQVLHRIEHYGLATRFPFLVWSPPWILLRLQVLLRVYRSTQQGVSLRPEGALVPTPIPLALGSKASIQLAFGALPPASRIIRLSLIHI